MKHWYKILSCTILITAFLLSCGSSGTATKSDNIESAFAGPIGSNAMPFLAIYEDILVTNCALSACHDGNFEPNFTSPQAAYMTTVMHEIKKNSADFSYTTRVVPFDTAQSILFERISNCCMINIHDRMPLLMEPLTDGQIDSIAQWILNGAPDPFGEFPYNQLTQY